MTLAAIIIGSAVSVGEAWRTKDAWRARGMRLDGAVVVGAGDVEPPLAGRIAAWDAFDPSSLTCEVLVLAEPPRSATLSRDLLHKAAAARMQISLLEGGRLRPLALGDLIGGSLADIDVARITKTFAGKRILITGGGGSIGSELARRIAACGPSHLTLLDSSEFNLFNICNELRDAQPGESLLLLNHVHQPADTPYRASHAIFVREGALSAYDAIDEIPEALHRRMLSLRAFDAQHLIPAAELATGDAIAETVRRLLADPATAYIHAHYATRGCYAAHIERPG